MKNILLRLLGIHSIRSGFLLAMTALILILSLPLLYSGIRIMDNLIDQYGMELLAAQLHARMEPVDRRYETLTRVGLEDSRIHRQEIMAQALKAFSGYRYKQTGRLFVIHRNRDILLSSDFKDRSSTDFLLFFKRIRSGGSPVLYRVGGVNKRAVVRYYQPWNCYVGLSMDEKELFAPRNLFVRFNLGVLALVLTVAILFTWWLQNYLVTPLINLARFASRVKQGDYPIRPKGTYTLELETLKNDLLEMVAALRSKMQESGEQVIRIREREEQLYETLTVLQEKEERYRAIFNAPSDAILIHDPETGEFLEVNTGAEKLYGYSAEELSGLGIEDISQGSSPYGAEEAGEKMSQAVSRGAVRFEWLAKKKDGTVFWVDVSLHYVHFGEHSYVLAVVRDIDERKLAELALAREKEQLAVTLRSIGDGVITTDLEGRVILLNRVAERLTGWDRHEAQGRLLPEVFHIVDEKTGQPATDPAAEVLRTGKIIELANHTMLLGRDGRRHAIADSAAPIYAPDSQVIGVVVVFRDVTEKYRLEQEVFKVKKLESVGVLAGGIAHDFNNILAAILGNISLARTRMQAESISCERVEALLAQAEKAGGQARHLTNQLLTFSKGGDPVKQTASISEIIRESVGFVLRGSSVQCSYTFAEDLWFAEVDPGQISQVIQNIILNARQAMPKGGQIRITAENCQDCSGETPLLREGCIRVIISDDGPGIPSEVAENIFDPYFSTRTEGSGLGLAICHSILEKHDGRISVSSTVGKGTTFTLLLPAGRQNMEQVPREKEPLSPGQVEILFMDDEEMVRELGMEMLSFLGHQVTTVSDGRAAVECYRSAMESGKPFDLVILDLTVPGGMGGREAADQLFQLDPKVRIIVSSGYSNDPVLAEYEKYGFTAMISKPYDVKGLANVIREAVQVMS